MTLHDEHLDDQLFAYHLGWLDRARMEDVESLIEANPAAAARSRDIQRQLAPLADWQALPACEGLERDILGRVARTEPAAWSITDAVRFDPLPPQRAATRWPLSLREVLAASFALLLVTAVVMPAWARAVSQAKRLRCADHLRDIGLARGQSRTDHGEHLPLAGDGLALLEPAANWLRERTPGVPRIRNSQNRYVLAASGYLHDMARFVCPADRQAIIMRVDHPADFDDFAEVHNDSYNSQLPVGPPRRGADPALVVYADANPLFDPQAGAAPPALMSRAHAGLAGQNVLRLDGASHWARTPNVGVDSDDIWRIGSRSNYSGSEVPKLATDSFMIP
jgi:hypothetical protein